MSQTATEIRDIPLDQLHAHPDNPRLQLRADVVDRLAAEIKTTGFGPEHALLVRPIDGGFQIISGHHRAEAAKNAECATAPCWVKELDDDEAFMQLVLSNTQGELSPLEIGMHALKAVPLAQGKAGGGLTAYAERIGVGQSYVSQLRSAAGVLGSLHYSSNEVDLNDKAKHLYEISRADRAIWPLLAEYLIKKSWTVAETKATVDKVRQFDVSNDHAAWLPLTAIAASFLANDRFNQATVTRLTKAADAVQELLEAEGTDDDFDAFRAWLVDNLGGASWRHQDISAYHADVVRTLAERRAELIRATAEEEEAKVVLPDGVDLRHGDFREILEDLEGKVDVIITDPPYPAEYLPLYGIRNGHEVDGHSDFMEDGLAEIAKRLLKPGGICAVMVGQSYLPEILERMLDNSGLTYHWTLAYLTPGGQAVQLWQRKVNTFWKPILIFTNGEYAGEWLGDVTKSDVNDNDKNHHHWGQSESGMADLVGRLSKPGQLVCDPFLGGGTTAVVCHGLGRKFVGCDIDETAVATSTARFARKETEA